VQVQTFDFIIVGGGTAGCVLANRLSENPGVSVLLVEAGGSDYHPILRIPLLAGAAYTLKSTNWNYVSEEEPYLGGRRIMWPRGKVLGGTSSINGMMHIRGNPGDFDRWESEGASGWSYKNVLPYFLKSEGSIDRRGPHHNANGPFKVARARSANPLYTNFLDACDALGYQFNEDLNGSFQDGVGRQDFNVYRGRRVSSATAYLHPISKRSNLRVVKNTHVARIIFDGSNAIGIECFHKKKPGLLKKYFSSTEIILSAGTVNSPQILQLSGLGNVDHLNKLGIPIIENLPGIGENLQDHLGAYVQVECTKDISLYRLFRKDRLFLTLVKAFLFRSGPGTSVPLEAGGFIKSSQENELPDFQITFCPGLSLETTLKGQGQHGYLVHYYLARPKSRGTIKIVNVDPRNHPAIRPNSLEHPEDMDLMKSGLKIARRILSQDSFDNVRGREISPGDMIINEDSLENWIRSNATTVWHPTSTCRMGTDKLSVVDKNLLVYGVNKLRVVDASIMPSITTGNTAAPTIMIAEKASDIIKDTYVL
tara:strand:+ start:17372 stop:18982 length:1611 start_codon:yes stop_codon:yes gene_type:complete